MARKPMVTRTFTTTNAKVLALNTETETPETVEVTLSRKYDTDKDVLKNAKSVAETDILKLVKVISYDHKETLYGMTEEDFLKNAEVLPERNATKAE